MSETREEPTLQPRLLRAVLQAARIGTWEVTQDNRLLWSENTMRLFGVDPGSFRGTMQEFFDLVHHDDLERVRLVGDFDGVRNAIFENTFRIVRPDGVVRHMRQTAIVQRDAAGRSAGFSGMIQDVTEQVTAEAQLRQAQKMEAIGQLSGGVAHDFNNILAAILSAAELMEAEGALDPELVGSIIASAKRGGELTHRLLAFARRQPLATQLVDASTLIRDIAPMLDRVTGPDIRLAVEIGSDLWQIQADPNQLQDALVNLTMNARDAITGAGTITIFARNTAAAMPSGALREFVDIGVRDTGAGMTEEIRHQASVPFFTTKAVGKGSGLGLSMVDGYVRQLGGLLEISSIPGEGTRVSMLMPPADADALPEPEQPAFAARGSGERVLVIEDNGELGDMVVRQLQSLGYDAQACVDMETALEAAAQAGGFDIVLSDVLLSDGARGPVVVDHLKRQYPDMQAVFMTGYAPDSDAISGMIDAARFVLAKPFNVEQLAEVMRRAAAARHRF
ncbi:MAG: ATP-binding protein [Pseudomonadota bacterium]